MPSKNKHSLTLREATREDIPAIAELNKAAYPRLAEENVVWGERHLLSHQRVFPRARSSPNSTARSSAPSLRSSST